MLLTVFITEALSVGNGFGGGSGPILLVDVLCVGTEQRLLDCPQSFPVGSGVSECSHTMDAGVACQPQMKVLCMPTTGQFSSINFGGDTRFVELSL